MAILSKGTDFTTGEQVTADRLDALVDDATFASGAVDGSTTQLNGSGQIIVKDGGITSAKLNLSATGASQNIAQFIAVQDSGNRYFNIRTPADTTSNNSPFELATGNAFKFLVDDNEVVIDSGGKVGIGTSSPSKELDVRSSLVPTIGIGHTDGVNGYILKSNVSSTSDFGFLIEDYSGTDLYNVVAGASGSHRFSIDGGEKLRIDSAGNVGINTTSPTATLHLNDIGSDKPTLFLQGAGASEGDIAVIDGESLQIGHWNNSDTFTERMRIKDDGNVGIGATNPLNKLQVASDNRFFYVGESGVTNYAQAGFRQSDNKPAYGNFTGYDINFQTGTTDSGLATVMHLDNDGKVGIGTTSPSYALEVTGDIKSSVDIRSGSSGKFISTHSTGKEVNLYHGSTYGVVGTTGETKMAIRTNNSDKLTVLSSGNVGIGDDNPSSKLSVTGDITASGNATVSGHITTDSVIGAEDNNALRLLSDPDAPSGTNGGSQIQLFSQDSGTPSQTYHNARYHIFAPLSGSAVMSINSDAAQIDVAGQIEFDFLKGTGSVAITDIKDEDNMSSNSATALATQQSIKAYVDLFKPNIVQDTDTVSRTFSGSSSTDFNDTELSLSITPRFSNSKFLINCSVAASTNSSDYPAYFRVLRDGSVVSGSVNTDSVGSNHVKMMFGANGGNTNQITSNASFTFLDGVASGGTSAITFKVQIASRNGGTVYMNRSKNFSNDASQASGISSLIVQEIYQ